MNDSTRHETIKNLPREWPTVVMVFGPNLFIVVFTAASTSFAALGTNEGYISEISR